MPTETASATTRRLMLTAPFAALGLGVIIAAKFRTAEARSIYVESPMAPAAGGYDVVAYFTTGRPTQGNAAITHTWRDAVWRFASADNRAAFAADPERYAPAYGGHCAWATSQGYRAPGDPRFWRIVNGRLFLNFDASVHRTWQGDIPRFIGQADRNWPRLAGQ